MSLLIWKTIQCSVIFQYHCSNPYIIQSVHIGTFYFPCLVQQANWDAKQLTERKVVKSDLTIAYQIISVI